MTWGDVYRENERQWSMYNFELAPVETLTRHFDEHEAECARRCSSARLADPGLRPGAEVLARVQPARRARRDLRHRARRVHRARPQPRARRSRSSTLERGEARSRGRACLTCCSRSAARSCRPRPAARRPRSCRRLVARGTSAPRRRTSTLGPRRLASSSTTCPSGRADEWVQGPPEIACASGPPPGFARRHGVDADALEERDGFLGVAVPGRPIADVLPTRLAEVVRGLHFGEVDALGRRDLRFSRPVRWLLRQARRGDRRRSTSTAFARGDVSYGHRFRRRRRRDRLAPTRTPTRSARPASSPITPTRPAGRSRALDALGDVERPARQARRGRVPRRAGVRARRVVRRAVPAPAGARGRDRDAVAPALLPARRQPLRRSSRTAATPTTILPGNERVLEDRLDDAAFTFDRDVAAGIDDARRSARLDHVRRTAAARSPTRPSGSSSS